MSFTWVLQATPSDVIVIWRKRAIIYGDMSRCQRYVKDILVFFSILRATWLVI